MDKINYNQHDWNKGEVIKEENLDNMENGIKQATDKINEIIDTEQEKQWAEKELNILQKQYDQQTADLIDMDIRVLTL